MAKIFTVNLIRNGKEAKEYMKCKRNPIYFIIHYIKTVSLKHGIVPFILYPFQEAVLLKFLKHTYNIILKPRQMGMSVLVCAYCLWFAMFHPYKNILIISIKMEVAKAMLRKIKSMYRYLPEFLKAEVANGSSTEIGTATRIAFSNGSEIQVSAATEDAGRSESVSLLIMDECAIQQYASAIWGAAQQTLATGGRAILLSTAYGVGNFFHQMWVDAIQKPKLVNPILLNWKMHPDRDMDWYTENSSRLGMRRTAQEIDCDFLSSGYNVFDLAEIRAIEDRLNDKSPIDSLMDGDLLVYHDFAETGICTRTEKTRNLIFTIGADVATGRSRDYSTFSIMDQYGKEYACYKGKIHIGKFAHLLMKWGYKYGTAWLAPEVNAIGEGVTQVIQENHYPNLYNSVKKAMKLDEFERGESLIQGWITTGKSRHEIITGMDEDLTDDLIEMNNPFFVQEAYNFIYNENGKPIALGKQMSIGRAASMYEDKEGPSYNDDSILAACITNEVRKNPGKYKGDMPFA